MDQDNHHRLALPPGTMLEEYRLERVLGKGGFGITYLAMDVRLQMRVAIKELLPSQFATRLNGFTVVAMSKDLEESYRWAVQRFEEESRVLAALSHENIVRVLRSFPSNNTVYLVMEYVEGESLKGYITKNGPFTSDRALKLLQPVLDGLQYVHSKKLLHRDIKPDNLFLTREGKIVLLDFGSARQDIGQQSVSHTSMVSKGFSPFEQYSTRGKQGPWTDIYALAATGVYMLTGRAVRDALDRYNEPEPKGWLRKVIGPGIPSAFAGALEHALAPRSEQRPQTVAQFKEELFFRPQEERPLRSDDDHREKDKRPSFDFAPLLDSSRLPRILAVVAGFVLLCVVAYLLWDSLPGTSKQVRHSLASNSRATDEPASADPVAPAQTPSPAPAAALEPKATPAPVATPAATPWVAGVPIPGYPHVIAAPEPGKLAPAPGYSWLTNAQNDNQVQWTPGKVHPDHPHVISAAAEGKWIAEPGYTWVSKETKSLDVVLDLENVEVKKKLVEFAIEFVRRKNFTTPEPEAALFANGCAYYGQPLGQAQIVESIREYQTKWPYHSFELADIGSVRNTSTVGSVNLVVTFRFAVKSSAGAKPKTGTAYWNITCADVSLANDMLPLITFIDESSGR